MLAVKSADARTDFREWCNKAIGGETVMVSNPMDGNIVILSEKEYEEMAKAKRNAEYLEKLQRGISALNVGKGTEHELIED